MAVMESFKEEKWLKGLIEELVSYFKFGECAL